MKKTIGIVMVLLMLMSVTVALAGVNKDAQPDKTYDGLQIFEKELSTTAGDEYVPDEFIVKFKPEVGKKKISEINLGHETSIKRAGSHFMRLNVPEGKTVDAMVEAYSRNPNVEYAEPNYIARTCMVPNDPFYGYQWHLDISEDDEIPEWHGENGGGINVEPAWNISTGAGVIVAVIDTGVAYEDYEEFVDNPGRGRDYWITYARAPDLDGTDFVSGYDFVNDDAHPNDDEGHGTHVTGTIAQTTNNGLGVAGVAFDCSIMPVKVLDKYGSGTYADITDGIYFAANNSAQVISMSLGGPASITLENAVKYAYEAGVTIVCASGNDGSSTTVSYPAAYDLYCIAVGATRYDEEVTYYSNGGHSLDLTAPGGQLYIEGTEIMLDQNNDNRWDGVLQQTHDGSDYTNFGYWLYQGTSMAAPHVSGVAALLISKGVATTPDEVREALESTAEDKGDTGRDPEYGWGIVDAYAALNYSAVPNEPPVADAGSPYSGMEDVAITFNGSGSYDIDGSITAYDWNFGDGNTGTGMTTTHTYETAGEYTVELTVTDNGTLKDTDTAIVTVTEVPAYSMHIANIDMSRDSTTRGRNTFVWVVATVTILDESDSPVEGATISGFWSGATSDSDSGLTDANGEVALNSDKVRNAPSGTVFTFTVDDVLFTGWTYNSAANAETSDSITVP